jgi:hypothetical protein
MILRLLLCLLLTACTRGPVVLWQTGATGPAPTLLPLDDLIAPTPGTAEARGAALAAQAAALRARTAR